VTIYKKLNGIREKVQYVVKDAIVGFGNSAYKAVTHDRVVNVTRPHFIDAGVLVVPTQVEKGISVPGKTSKGNDKIRFEAVYDVKFIDIESGDELVIRCEAHADDSGDKASNKALTYATKNAILKALMLETGEEETGEASRNTITGKQAVMLQSLVKETNSDEAKFLTTYGVEKYTDMSVDHFSHALNLLQTKQRNMKKETK
jgi:hypothetical protein